MEHQTPSLYMMFAFFFPKNMYVSIFYVSYAIPLVRPGFLSSELELPFWLLVLYSIGGIICSRAGISSSRAGNSSSRAGNSSSRANLSTYIKILEYKSQNSDKCAALTNHLSLLIKRNLQFFDILLSPVPGIEPGPLG